MKYNNLETLEDAYGIKLFSLAKFAMKVYQNDDCNRFRPKLSDDNTVSFEDMKLISQMHKAIAVIQFKKEGQIVKVKVITLEDENKFNLSIKALIPKENKEEGV